MEKQPLYNIGRNYNFKGRQGMLLISFWLPVSTVVQST